MLGTILKTLLNQGITEVDDGPQRRAPFLTQGDEHGFKEEGRQRW
jgi:hypothetical protein